MSKINYDQLFDDILKGDYDEDGYEIYRVFRDQYGMILKCVFTKKGVFFEYDLNRLLHGNTFKPKNTWKLEAYGDEFSLREGESKITTSRMGDKARFD